MKILFIRHSKTVLDKYKSNLQWQLSEEGIKLVEKYSTSSLFKNIDKIISSNQTKAIHTALLLASPNYIPLETNPGLTETTSVTNGFIDNFETNIEEWFKGDYRINNGETRIESEIRFNNTVEKIANDNYGLNHIGIVAHGSVLACFSAKYSGQNAYSIHKTLSMPDFAIFNYEKKEFTTFWGELL